MGIFFSRLVSDYYKTHFLDIEWFVDTVKKIGLLLNDRQIIIFGIIF